MNRIYWDIDKIAMLTDHMDATAHSHGMIQFFLCLEGNLQIKAAGEIRVCPCIAVNQNVRHSFRAGSKRHLTIVFDPMSPMGIRLSRLMEGAPCRIFGEADIQALLPPALAMVQTFDADTYHRFIKALHGVLQADPPTPMDDRIRELLAILEHCDCHEHAIERYADTLCLSPSRLSHLFSEAGRYFPEKLPDLAPASACLPGHPPGQLHHRCRHERRLRFSLSFCLHGEAAHGCARPGHRERQRIFESFRIPGLLSWCHNKKEALL